MNMYKMNMGALLPAILVCSVMGSILPASAEEMAPSPAQVKLLGGPASPESAERTLTITANIKSLNVVGGETVKFIMGDKVFAWHFDDPLSSIKLNEVAPAGMLDHVVTVYVAPNPLYL